MDHDDNKPAKTSQPLAKLALGAMAAGAVLASLAIYHFQSRLGIDDDTARLVSTVLLLAGVADTFILYFWDSIFKRSD